MSISSNDPQQSLTTQDVGVWLLAAAEKHAAIHLKAAHPWNGQGLHEAFTDMSVLFLEAFEEVRVVSAQLREESQAARSQSIALRDHYPNSSTRAWQPWNTWGSLSHPLLKRYARPKARY